MAACRKAGQSGLRKDQSGVDRVIASGSRVSDQCVERSPKYRWTTGPKAWRIPLKQKLIPTNPKVEHTQAAWASQSRIKPTPQLELIGHVYIATRPAKKGMQSADVNPS